MYSTLGSTLGVMRGLGLGLKFQKYTSLWLKFPLHSHLQSTHTLHMCDCRCNSHGEVARGRNRARKWKSAEAAAYPAQMNAILAEAVAKTLPPDEEEFLPQVSNWYVVNEKGQLSQTERKVQ